MDRWIVILNCQTFGITNSLALQNPGVSVESYDINRFRKEIDYIRSELRSFDAIFVNDEVVNLNLINFSNFSNVIRVPPIEFCGYHPDLCYAWAEGKVVSTPLGDYNSTICLAAFNKGLTERRAQELFNANIFNAAGYFDIWSAEKKRLLDNFKSYDYDMTASFKRWASNGIFMYSINHPKIDCLYDLAMVASVKAGRDPIISDHRPHDNLCNGATFPVYKEIAEIYSVNGSYLFKSDGAYRLLTLEQYISASYESYRRYANPIEPHGKFAEQYSVVFEAI